MMRFAEYDEYEDVDEGDPSYEGLMELSALLDKVVDRAKYYGEHTSALLIFGEMKMKIDRMVDKIETRNF